MKKQLFGSLLLSSFMINGVQASSVEVMAVSPYDNLFAKKISGSKAVPQAAVGPDFIRLVLKDLQEKADFELAKKIQFQEDVRSARYLQNQENMAWATQDSLRLYQIEQDRALALKMQEAYDLKWAYSESLKSLKLKNTQKNEEVVLNVQQEIKAPVVANVKEEVNPLLAAIPQGKVLRTVADQDKNAYAKAQDSSSRNGLLAAIREGKELNQVSQDEKNAYAKAQDSSSRNGLLAAIREGKELNQVSQDEKNVYAKVQVVQKNVLNHDIIRGIALKHVVKLEKPVQEVKSLAHVIGPVDPVRVDVASMIAHQGKAAHMMQEIAEGGFRLKPVEVKAEDNVAPKKNFVLIAQAADAGNPDAANRVAHHEKAGNLLGDIMRGKVLKSAPQSAVHQEIEATRALEEEFREKNRQGIQAVEEARLARIAQEQAERDRQDAINRQAIENAQAEQRKAVEMARVGAPSGRGVLADITNFNKDRLKPVVQEKRENIFAAPAAPQGSMAEIAKLRAAMNPDREDEDDADDGFWD